jgi:hypothetical protein
MPVKVKIPAEVYSRVSGYFRPVNQWNRGKQEEYTNRVTINVSSLTGQAISSSTERFGTTATIS